VGLGTVPDSGAPASGVDGNCLFPRKTLEQV